MEYRWAAEGSTEELRQWLREHPERVNVPSKGANMTLLYTCISNSNRTDLASLQAGYSRHLSTVRMLCEEYKADVLAANGGSHNTALHLAASLGATEVMRYLVEVLRTPVDRQNVFGEQPLQLAQRNGHADCVAILTNASAQHEHNPSNACQSGSPTPPQQAAQGGSGRFQSLAIADSDEDSDADANGGGRRGGGARGQHTAAPARAQLLSPPMSDAGTGSLLSPLAQLLQQQSSAFSAAAGGSATDAQAQQQQQQRSSVGASERSCGAAAGGLPRTASASSGVGFSTGITPATSLMFVQPPPASATTTAAAAQSAALPPPVRPRKEYDISSSRILSNPDLQGFRSAYGAGFRYIQCSDHYEIRGILPYTYRGTVYYTPVIISVYAPAPSTSASMGGVDGPGESPASSPTGSAAQANAYGPSHTPAPPSGRTEVYCRYRVCLNMQSLNDFAVSRKAEYLDPVSGAVIPAPGDDKYQTLTAYVRNVVVRNFEAVPPLIVPTSSYAFPLRPNVSQLGSSGNADVYRHHHSHNAPAFMKNALGKRTAAHIRTVAILRDLSRFGDGLARYFPDKHRIVAYVPIFSEHKAAVLAVPQERPYTTTVGQAVATPPASGAAVGAGSSRASVTGDITMPMAGGKAGVIQQVAVEAVAELQVRVLLHFQPTRVGTAQQPATAAGGGDAGDGSGVYAYPPRLYLVDAAAASSSAKATLTAQCFAGLIKERETGEVRPELVRLSQESWSAGGSVYDILVELQRALRGVLEAYAMSHTGRGTSSASPKPPPLPASGYAIGGAAAAGALGGGGGGGSRGAPGASALDTFFATPTTQSQPTAPRLAGSGSGAGAGESGAGPRSSSGYCLYCAQPLHASRALLQPCGHDGMCGLCVQRLQSHCREEVFGCPVCRSPVRTVMEVFL